MQFITTDFAKLRVLPALRIMGKLALCLASILPTIGLSSCTSKPTAVADQPVAVKVRTPNQADQPITVAVSGAAESSQTAMTAFEVSGRVKRVYVEEGQHVIKGQVLAEIDATDYQHAYESSRGQADAARATQLKTQNGLRPQELEEVRIAFERAQDEYRRMKFLFDQSSLSANDFHKFEAAYLSAKQNYELALQGSRTEDKQAAEAQAHAAIAQMQDAKSHVAKCRLVAPISGFIGMKRINTGDFVSAGTPVFSVLDLDIVNVRVTIPEAEIDKTHVGAVATVTVPSLPGHSFQGTLDTLGVTADPLSRTYAAKISVPNKDHLLRDGMVSQARIFGKGQVRALTVPVNAVVRDAHGVSNVYVYNPSRHMAFARRVDIGDFLGSEVIIQSGLSPKDQVVIAGQQNLREGSYAFVAGGAQ